MMSYKPEYCDECAKRMGEDPDLQKDRILFYLMKNYTDEYVCPVCKHKVNIAWSTPMQSSSDTPTKEESG